MNKFLILTLFLLVLTSTVEDKSSLHSKFQDRRFWTAVKVEKIQQFFPLKPILVEKYLAVRKCISRQDEFLGN